MNTIMDFFDFKKMTYNGTEMKVNENSAMARHEKI